MTHAENEIDLSWAHPALAKSARKIFRAVRRDSEGRLNLADMKARFGRHGTAMLEGVEQEDDGDWAFLCDRWQAVLKDWGMCVGVSGYCVVEG